MTILLIISILVLLLFGLPLYIALFGISALLYLTLPDLPLITSVISFQKLSSQEFISAIPLFTFSGYLMANGKTPDRIVGVFRELFASFRGGEAAIVVLIMAFFTALTGASGVSILALGGLLYPLLIHSGNKEKFSLGLVTSSGSIGLLLAPSLPVIIFSIISTQNNVNVQINYLFTAAVIPSLILIGSVILYSIVIAIINKNKADSPETHHFSLKNFLKALWVARFQFPIPLIIYGGIYSGFFTVLEAALITTIYVFIVEFFVHRDITFKKDFQHIVIESMKLSGGIFIIMACAFILTNYLVMESIPSKAFDFVSPIIQNKLMFLLILNIFLLIIGCLLDIFSAIMIVLPFLLPIVVKYGIDPYHFAIIFLVNLEIGYMTPPVGMNLFIAGYRFKKPITDLYKATVPFLLIMLVVLFVLTYIPALSTFRLPADAFTDLTPPAKVKTIEVVQLDFQGGRFSFESPGDDNMDGTPKSYEIRYAEEPITDIDIFDFSLEPAETPETVKGGDVVQFEITELTPGTTYYVCVRTIDEAGNASELSPNLKFETLPESNQ